MKYKGSCHCGKVAFEVEGDFKDALACNCSMCQRRGSLLWFAPRSAFHSISPDSAANTYTFNKHVIKHRFCANCGIHAYGEGVDPKGNPMIAVNARCIEGIDLATVPVKHYDGRSA